MSAPIEAYSGKKLEFESEYPLALKLSEYSGDEKGLFYLDLLFIAKNGSDEGFIGAVELGSSNASMRSSSRIGKGRIKRSSDGKVFILLNDAGLNTYASIGTGIGYRLTYPPVASILTKSSYYSLTNQGFEIKINGGSPTIINLPDVVANATYNEDEDIPGSLGDMIELRGFATNEEGTNYSAWQSAYIRPDEYYFRYSRVNNGDGTMTFSVVLFPIAFEVNLSVTFAQGYSGSGTISYCTVTVLAGNTTGSNNLTLLGTPLASYSVSSYIPTALSDLTPVENNGELALKYHVHLILSDYSSDNFAQLFIEIRDDDNSTPVNLPSPIDISLTISGDTESGFYSENIPVNGVQFDFEERELTLNYETGDTLSNVTMLATSTPLYVDGREIIFHYSYI